MYLDKELVKIAANAYRHSTYNIGNSSALVVEKSDAFIIAFRGTDDFTDIMAALWASPWKPRPLNAWCHRGFWRYTEPLIKPLLRDIASTEKPVHLTGHSLGGASACIFGAICHQKRVEISTLTTFGAPRPGYASLAALSSPIRGHRYTIDGDQVTMVPPSWFAFPYRHDRPEVLLAGLPGVIDHPISGYVEAVSNL